MTTMNKNARVCEIQLSGLFFYLTDIHKCYIYIKNCVFSPLIFDDVYCILLRGWLLS